MAVRRLVPVLVLAAAAFGVTVAFAAGSNAPGDGGHKAAAWPGQCVAETPFIRRNHMDMLKHQRDVTVREGERPAKGHSFNECLTCHAVKDASGNPVTAADNRHFCVTCHESAAVQIDCFSCHNSAPGLPAPAKP